MTRLSTPISIEQATRAYARLRSDDAERIAVGVEKLMERTGMGQGQALAVFAALGKFYVEHSDGLSVSNPVE